jgi:hypothetical protein
MSGQSNDEAKRPCTGISSLPIALAVNHAIRGQHAQLRSINPSESSHLHHINLVYNSSRGINSYAVADT